MEGDASPRSYLPMISLSATFFASAVENKNHSNLIDFLKRLTFTAICSLVCGGINVLIFFGFKSLLKYSNSFIIKVFLWAMVILVFYFLIVYTIVYLVY